MVVVTHLNERFMTYVASLQRTLKTWSGRRPTHATTNENSAYLTS